MYTRYTTTLLITLLLIAGIFFAIKQQKSNLPIVAIANYGPHSSLDASIKGMKEELAKQGFIEGRNIAYEISDVGFDANLIPQMIAKLTSQQPKVMVVMTTPIAQYAKGSIHNIPLIYNVITDPVEAGLLHEHKTPEQNITGSSDQQNLGSVLAFVKKLLPHAKRAGLLYSTAESNDATLVRMMKAATIAQGFELVTIPVEQSRDVAMRMQQFNEKVDFIYVGTSGPIQPTLPVISAEATKIGIPIINVDAGAVKDGLVLASFGVDYVKVGNNAGKLVAEVLRGVPVSKLTPIYPKDSDHHGFISMKKAHEIGISIPAELKSGIIGE